MDELKDLIRIAFSDRIKKIEIINSEDVNKKSQFFKLADGIHKGKFKSDEEASKAILDKPASNSAYKMLKKRLKERLYNTLLFIQAKNVSTNSLSHQLFECYRQATVAKMLLSIGVIKAGTRITTKVMAKAQELELFDIVQQTAIMLRRQTIQSGDFVRFEEFNAIFKEANKKILAEAKAEHMNYDILINFSQSLIPQAQIKERLEKYKLKINKLREKYPTFQINYYFYYISIVYHQLRREYNEALVMSTEFENYFINSGIFYNPVRHANILIVKLDASLLAKNYQLGHESAQKAQEFFPKGHINWFKLQEYYFLLCLNTAKLDEAVKAYTDVNSDSLFNSIEDNQKELWRVYGGYLRFVITYMDRESKYPQLFGEGHSFRMSSLMNDIPHYSKDTKGIRVAVLILQILFFIQQGEFVKITNRIETLRLYLYRYLSKEEAYRSHYFIKMLIITERYNFEPVKSREVAAKYLWKLMEGNMQYTPTQTQIEIIPYEDLWAIAMNMLTKPKNKAVA